MSGRTAPTRAQTESRMYGKIWGAMALAAVVVSAMLRTMRTERGDAVAAREIQQTLPQLTLGQVAEIVHSL